MQLFIKTFGCAMNERDSEHLIEELRIKENYTLTQDPKQADLILINTCSVREKPEKKLFSEIGIYSKIKKPSAKIGICGCSASILGEQIIKKAPSVDFVLGARNVSKISEIIHKPKAVITQIDYDESNYEFCASTSENFRALINISIGCDKKCAYCIVPKTRGSEISIPLDMILNEARFRAQNGAKEIILLGQNVNNYGARFSIPHKKINFTQLLREVSQIDGIERIKFISPHPLHMDDEFIDEFSSNKKIAKYIHIPLQSGSDSILKAMRRGYNKEWFLNRIKRIKSLVPSVGIGTDIIVGFPGENEDDFNHTLDVVKKVDFDTIYSFIYSPRSGTQAANLPEIPRDITQRRLEVLQDLHKKMLAKKSKKEIGKIYSVMIEQQHDGFFEGRGDNGRLVKIALDSIKQKPKNGGIYPVKITENKAGSLFGEIMEAVLE